MKTYWSTKELDILQKHYPYMSAQHLQSMLPGRSLSSIYKKARYLGLQAYRRKEYYISLFCASTSRSTRQLADMAGCSEGNIRYRMRTILTTL